MNFPFHVDSRSAAETGSELDIQKRFRRDLKRLAPGVRSVAVPNGGQRTAWAAMKAKQEGMSAGYPDLLIIGPDGLRAELEFKARDGSLSEAQADWLGWLHRNGHHVGVFRSARTALLFLHGLGFPLKCDREALAA